MRAFISMTLAISVVLLSACGEPTPPSSPVGSTAAPSPTTEPTDDGVRVVVLGDSIAAGLGLAENEAFPAVAERLLREAGSEVSIVNAGVSGDTSAGGVRRLDWLLRQQPDVVVVELGANDALRGQPLDSTEANLREIVRRSRAAGARVLLLGMDVPTNYGPDYTEGFARLYERVAREEEVTLVPGFIRRVGVDLELMQSDGLHPTAAGQRALAQQLVPVLRPLVDSIAATKSSAGVARSDHGAR